MITLCLLASLSSQVREIKALNLQVLVKSEHVSVV